MAMLLHIQEASGRQREVVLERGLLTLGRDAGCDIVLGDPQASRHHAELRRSGDQWLLVDTGSTNGTFLAGAQLRPNQAYPLAVGQTATIGATRLVLTRAPDRATDVLPAGYFPQANQPAPAMGSAAAGEHGGPGPLLLALAWLSRVLVAAAAGLLLIGSQSEWLRIQVRVPLLGTVVDRTFDGMDSGYGLLLLAVAAVALVLMLVDLMARRWGLAAGLGQALLGAFTAVALAANAYAYYQAGSQSVLGISMIDILTQYARNFVNISLQTGIYWVGAGLASLILGGLLRLIVASASPLALEPTG